MKIPYIMERRPWHRKINSEYNILSWENMDLPNALYHECRRCAEETLHRVIKGRIGEKKLVVEAVLKCQKCGHVHPGVIRAERFLTVPVILSDLNISKKSEIELSEQKTIQTGDEFLLDGGTIKITAIETKKGRIKSSVAKDVIALWAKRFDRLKLKVSINRGSRTLSRTIWAVPDEEFFVGDVVRIKGDNVAIHIIKTKNKHLKKGSAQARDIIRLYGKIVR